MTFRRLHLNQRPFSRIVILSMCLAAVQSVYSANNPAGGEGPERAYYRVDRNGSLIVLSLFSQAELPAVRHELLSNQEGLVLHLSRKIDLQPQDSQKGGPLLILPSQEDGATSILVLSAGISGITKTEESGSQISYWIAIRDPEVAKYYDERGRAIEAAQAEQKAKQEQTPEETPDQKAPPSSVPPATPGQKGSPSKGVPPRQTADNLELPPRIRLNGSVAAGFYHATNEDSFSETRDSVLNNVRFDLAGYLHDPRFLTFDVKPQLSVGRQTSEAVVPDGRGVAVSTTFLGGGDFPLTFSYSRLTRQLVTFGVLDRLAGLEADSSQSSLGVSWDLKFPSMPHFTFSYSRYTDSYIPLQPLTSQIENHAKIFSANAKDQRWGWDWNTEFRVEETDEDLLNAFSPDQQPFRFTRHAKELRATASRDFAGWMNVNVFAGHSASQNEVASHPFDQDFSYVNGSIHFGQGKRLSGMIRGGVVTNLVGFQLAQTLPSALGQSGNTLPQSGVTPLENAQARSTLFTFSGNFSFSSRRTSAPTDKSQTIGPKLPRCRQDLAPIPACCHCRGD